MGRKAEKDTRRFKDLVCKDSSLSKVSSDVTAKSRTVERSFGDLKSEENEIVIGMLYGATSLFKVCAHKFEHLYFSLARFSCSYC